MAWCHRLYLSTGLDLSSSCQPERSHNRVQTVVGPPLSRGQRESAACPPGNSFETLLSVNRVLLECNNFMIVTVDEMRGHSAIFDFLVALGMTFTSKYTCLITKWSYSREHRLVEALQIGPTQALLDIFVIIVAQND